MALGKVTLLGPRGALFFMSAVRRAVRESMAYAIDSSTRGSGFRDFTCQMQRSIYMYQNAQCTNIL